MIAGSSDSGSTLLMIVTSAVGSCREQLKTKAQTDRQKRKRARRKIRRARLLKAIFYFTALVAAAAAFVTAAGIVESRLFAGAGAVCAAGCGAGAVAGACICFC